MSFINKYFLIALALPVVIENLSATATDIENLGQTAPCRAKIPVLRDISSNSWAPSKVALSRLPLNQSSPIIASSDNSNPEPLCSPASARSVCSDPGISPRDSDSFRVAIPKSFSNLIRVGELPSIQEYITGERLEEICTSAIELRTVKPVYTAMMKDPALRLLILSGDNTAQFSLGVEYAQKNSVAEGVVMLASAAAEHNVRALYNLGAILAEDNIDLAKKCFRLAAESGHANSQYLLGCLLVSSNVPEAMEWFEKSSEQLHIKASLLLKKIGDHKEGSRFLMGLYRRGGAEKLLSCIDEVERSF